MTPEALAAIRERELIVLKMRGDNCDIFLAGQAVIPAGDQVASYYIAHPSVPLHYCLDIVDSPGYEFIPLGKTLNEGFANDPEFRAYWNFAVNNLDVQQDSPAAGYIYCSVAITFAQAAHCSALEPSWFTEPNNIPLSCIDDAISLCERVDDFIREFCEILQSKNEVRVLN